jgi:hypothetical protein
MRYYTGVWDKELILPGYPRPPVASKGERTWIIGSGVGVISVGVV